MELTKAPRKQPHLINRVRLRWVDGDLVTVAPIGYRIRRAILSWRALSLAVAFALGLLVRGWL